jgi:hypothetical protein
MLDPSEVRIDCANPDRIIGEVDRIMPLLNLDVRRKLNAIKMQYLAAYGIVGVYERFDDRTVFQILNEHSERDAKSVVEGTRDGTQFTLFELRTGIQEPDEQANERAPK